VDAIADCSEPVLKADVLLRQMHHPDWSAVVNDSVRIVRPDGLGMCAIEAPLQAGENRIAFRFTGRGYRKAMGMQAAAWGILLGLWGWIRRRK
jgi:hypothetical protein